MPSENTEQRKLAAIMFTDIVGYSALSQRNEALALELLAENQRLLRAQFPLFNGREVKTTGDGFLVEFPSALQATQCAVEIQRAVATRNGAQPAERHIHVRIGIHVGDVVHREADMYGDGVNIAARIEPLAIGGGICLSDTVYAQVRNKLEVGLTKLDSPDLKHIEVPMEVYRVVLPWEKPRTNAGRGLRNAESKPSRVTSVATKMVCVSALVLLAVGLGWWFLHRRAGSTSAKKPAGRITSLAVKPLDDFSGDTNQAYLSDGMTEALCSALGNVSALRVPGRSSVMRFKGGQKSIQEIANELNVDAIVEGSVQRAANRVLITVQLVEAASDRHLWATNYQRDLSDFFKVQSEVAVAIANEVQARLTPEDQARLARARGANSDAIEAYLLGRYHFGKNTAAGWTNAMQYFNRALQVDPSYALAYCGLADVYGWTGGWLPGKEAWSREKELAQKALALEPNLADAHLSLGLAVVGAFDWPGAEREIKRALELNPKLALAYDQYAWLQTMTGQFEEAFKNARKAIELDPFSPMFNADLASWLMRGRRYDEAIIQARKTLELDPYFASVRSTLGWCFLQKGDVAGAIAEFQKAKSLDPQPEYDAYLGCAYVRAGDRAKGEQALRDLEDLVKQRYISPGLRVHLHLNLGQKDKALDWLEKCYEEQDGACWNLKVDPLYDPVRNESRFQALLKKVGFDK